MSRSAAAITPGSTNRRFVMLAVTLGLIGAVLVYVAFSRDSGSSGSASGPSDTPVVVAKVDIPARTQVLPAMIEVVLVPADVYNSLAIADPTLVVGKITRFPIAAREQVLTTKIVDSGPAATARSLSYIIPKGKRAFAINASEVQNAGGLLLPGDYVDVVVVYDVEFQNGTERVTADAYLARTIMQNIEVLAVSQIVNDIVPEAVATPGAGGTASLSSTSANTQRARNSEAAPQPAAATVTLAVTPEQVQTLYLAEENGRIRLSVRAFEDGEEQPIEFITENELFPRNLPNPFTR